MCAIRERSGDKGYTLVELAITLAIVGILATLAVPNFRGVYSRYKYSAAARHLGTNLTLARLQAISHNREYRIAVDEDNDQYVIFQGNSSDNSTSWTAKSMGSLSPDADIYNVESLPSDNITFNPDGTMDDESSSPDGIGRIYIRNGDGSLRNRITIIAATGRMTTERWVGSDWKDERYLKE